MDGNQFLSLIGQYRQQGKDIDTLYSEYAALLSAGKTPLGLNQWVKSDKPLMEDFNADNRIIDETLRELAQSSHSFDEKLRELAENKMERGLPQAHPLDDITPSGFYAHGFYSINENGLASLNGRFVKNGTVADREIVATLPVGFRPPTVIIIPVVSLKGANIQHGQPILELNEAGVVKIYGPVAESTSIQVCTTYYARES